MASLAGQVAELDSSVELIRKLMRNGEGLDREMAAGIGITEPLDSLQKKMDLAMAACEELDGHVRDIARGA